jgi:DNA-binding transcriptional regulator PaaX
VRDRIPLNGHVGFRRLLESLTELGHSEASVSLAIRVMLSRGELVRKSEGKVLQRRAA